MDSVRKLLSYSFQIKDGTNNPATQRAYHISEITSDRERLSIGLL